MFKYLLGAVALFISYKIGEQKSKLNTSSFILTRVYSTSVGVSIVEYLVIKPTTGIIFTQDLQAATVLNYTDAVNFKEVLRKYIPFGNLQLELVSNELIKNENGR